MALIEKKHVKNVLRTRPAEYRDNIKKTPIAGIDLVFDEPLVNELVIGVDSESADASLARITVLLSERNQSEA